MKYSLSFFLYLLIFFSFALIECNKDDAIQGTCVDGIQNQGETGIDCGGPCTACNIVTIPVVSTATVTSVTATKAETGGNITSSGNASVTSAGVCWSTVPNPTVSDAHTNDFAFPDTFASSLTSLNISTAYYVRAYAINSAGIAYGNEINFTTDSLLTVGDNYAGGIVFYLDSTRFHGYVCAETDQASYVEWGCYVTDVSAAAGTTLGTGQANTAAIVAAGCAGYAANICSDLVLNGYSDWFLPSRDELRFMATNLAQAGMGHFIAGYYWSSSDSSAPYATGVSFPSSNWLNLSKHDPHPVRAIRAF
jgi:hypothetical protein